MLATCEECETLPSFNTKGITKPRFCVEHKRLGMVNVVSRTCESCDTQPAYNFEGNQKARFCVTHKEEGMVNVLKTCELCGRQPSYNTKGQKKARFCATHRFPGMVNVRSTLCTCGKIPTFNFPGNKAGIFCVDHKEVGMICVKSRLCECCGKRATYNVLGEKTGRFCRTHKEIGMVNIQSKLCERCGTIPVYNFKGSKVGRFCFEHKEEGMIDIKSPACDQGDCNRRPTYGFPGKRANRCYVHRETGTIVAPTRKCAEAGCSELAIWGVRTHEHCERHAIPSEVNLLEQRCTSCTLLTIVDSAGRCETCDPAAFKRVRLAKQNMVRDFLLAQRITFETVDKMVDGGACGRERPDFYIDCGTHILIIEVDEHQHSERACECEQTRMVNVSQSNGMRTMFLRWNPDKYKTRKGQKMDTTARRLDVLLEYVRHYQTTPPPDFLNVIYLYVDDFVYGDAKVETILAMDNSL